MNALTLHLVFYWIAFAAFGLSAIAVWLPVVPRRVVLIALYVGLVSGALSAAARWVVTAHPPIFGTFENTMAASWSVAAVALWLLARRSSDCDVLTPRLLLAWVPALLTYGLFFPRTPYPLTISERSIIIDIHVFFAWSSFALLLAASMAGFARLVARNPEQSPSSDRLVVRGLGLGFALFTVMIAVGSLYSYVLFADWYRWEIVGASAMAAWLGYGAALHAHLMFGWRGRRLAWCAIAMLPLLLVVFWSWSLFSGTYHFFDLTAIKAQ